MANKSCIFLYIGPISPAEEAVDLKSIQAQFESAIGHFPLGGVWNLPPCGCDVWDAIIGVLILK